MQYVTYVVLFYRTEQFFYVLSHDLIPKLQQHFAAVCSSWMT